VACVSCPNLEKSATTTLNTHMNPGLKVRKPQIPFEGKVGLLCVSVVLPDALGCATSRVQSGCCRDSGEIPRSVFKCPIFTSGTSAASLSASSCLLHESRTTIIVGQDLRSPVELAHDSAGRVGKPLDPASAPACHYSNTPIEASRRRLRFCLSRCNNIHSIWNPHQVLFCARARASCSLSAMHADVRER
jgi:hypothetical protein